MDGPAEVEIGRLRAEAQGVLRQVKAITADAETALRDGNLTPAQGDRAKARLSELNGRLVPSMPVCKSSASSRTDCAPVGRVHLADRLEIGVT